MICALSPPPHPIPLLLWLTPPRDPESGTKICLQGPSKLPSRPSPFWSTTAALSTAASSSRLRLSVRSSPGTGRSPRGPNGLPEPRGDSCRLEQVGEAIGQPLVPRSPAYPQLLPALPNPAASIKGLRTPGLSRLKLDCPLLTAYGGHTAAPVLEPTSTESGSRTRPPRVLACLLQYGGRGEGT